MAIVGGAAALIALGSTGTAAAGSLITSQQIQDGTIRVADVRPDAADRLSGSDGDVSTIVGAGYADLNGHDYWARWSDHRAVPRGSGHHRRRLSQDAAGNVRANQWVVRGYNQSDQQVDVRAWVVCAPLAS